MMGFLDWLLGRPTFHDRVAQMRKDRDRAWNEMMTHWNEADRKLPAYGPTPATLTDMEEVKCRLTQ